MKSSKGFKLLHRNNTPKFTWGQTPPGVRPQVVHNKNPTPFPGWDPSGSPMVIVLVELFFFGGTGQGGGG